MKTWQEIKNKDFSEEEIKQLDALVNYELVKMTLQEIRKNLGLTQEELARTLELSQPELSRFERSNNPLLATLRRYIEALGGELEIQVVLGNKRITLEDFGGSTKEKPGERL